MVTWEILKDKERISLITNIENLYKKGELSNVPVLLTAGLSYSRSDLAVRVEQESAIQKILKNKIGKRYTFGTMSMDTTNGGKLAFAVQEGKVDEFEGQLNQAIEQANKKLARKNATIPIRRI